MEKKYFIGLMALIMGMFVLASCSSDDDEETANVDRASLVGKWINTRIDWDDRDGHDYETYNNSNRYLLLENDGTGKVSPYNLFEDEKRNGFSWSVSKNKLITVEPDGDREEYIIVKVTANELVLRWDDSPYLIETHTFKRYEGTNN